MTGVPGLIEVMAADGKTHRVTESSYRKAWNWPLTFLSSCKRDGQAD